jgi:hypothetical protein
MSRPRLRTLAFAFLATAGLSACAEGYGGYGYSGVSVGYGSPGWCDPYYFDCRYYGGYGYGAYGFGEPYWGWWGNYYYPGVGFYIYDSYGRRYPWDERYRRYWEGRRGTWGHRNWNDPRWQRWDGYRSGSTGSTRVYRPSGGSTGVYRPSGGVSAPSGGGGHHGGGHHGGGSGHHGGGGHHGSGGGHRGH